MVVNRCVCVWECVIRILYFCQGNCMEIQITWKRGTATDLRWEIELCDLYVFLLSVTLGNTVSREASTIILHPSTGESSLEKVFGGARLEVCWPRCWRRENGNCGVGRWLLGQLYLVDKLVRFSWHVGKYKSISCCPCPNDLGSNTVLWGEGSWWTRCLEPWGTGGPQDELCAMASRGQLFHSGLTSLFSRMRVGLGT